MIKIEKNTKVKDKKLAAQKNHRCDILSKSLINQLRKRGKN
jgi:hypothetical protein